MKHQYPRGLFHYPHRPTAFACWWRDPLPPSSAHLLLRPVIRPTRCAYPSWALAERAALYLRRLKRPGSPCLIFQDSRRRLPSRRVLRASGRSSSRPSLIATRRDRGAGAPSLVFLTKLPSASTGPRWRRRQDATTASESLPCRSAVGDRRLWQRKAWWIPTWRLVDMSIGRVAAVLHGATIRWRSPPWPGRSTASAKTQTLM